MKRTCIRHPAAVNERDTNVFKPRLIPVLIARLRSTNPDVPQDLIEDAVGDAVLAWWMGRGMLGVPVTMEWVRRKALWRLRTILKGNGKPFPDLPVPDQEGLERHVERLEILRRVTGITHSSGNEAVLALWMNDWTSTEIARHLGLSPVTVRKRIERCITRFRKECASWDEGCHTHGAHCVNYMAFMEVEHEDREGRKEIIERLGSSMTIALILLTRGAAGQEAGTNGPTDDWVVLSGLAGVCIPSGPPEKPPEAGDETGGYGPYEVGTTGEGGVLPIEHRRYRVGGINRPLLRRFLPVLQREIPERRTRECRFQSRRKRVGTRRAVFPQERRRVLRARRGTGPGGPSRTHLSEQWGRLSRRVSRKQLVL